jgi:hypothetical protein
MSTIPEFIDACGGATKVAKVRNLPLSTVASWKARNSIPVDEWPALLELARQCEIEGVSYETMVLMHTQNQSAM